MPQTPNSEIFTKTMTKIVLIQKNLYPNFKDESKSFIHTQKYLSARKPHALFENNSELKKNLSMVP
jgi:hypothetical protein